MRSPRGGLAASASDAELLAAHVAGNRYAFAELFNRHQNYLWRVARRICATPQDAEDALQEAMLSAHRTAANFRHDAAVLSWLHRIVVNACLDRIRRNRSRPTVALPDHETDDHSLRGAVGRHHVDDPTAHTDVTLIVEAALLSVPVEQRAAIMLVDIYGYSVADAAEVLGVPVGTVKSRCSRARGKLAEVLRAQEIRGNRTCATGGLTKHATAIRRERA